FCKEANTLLLRGRFQEGSWMVAWLWCAACRGTPAAERASVPLQLGRNDVVAFIGGSDVAAAQQAGHLEALLAIRFPGTRFCNFGWEGDTVFAQRREVAFPPLRDHLRRARATVLFVEFGRAEALGSETVSNFVRAYE